MGISSLIRFGASADVAASPPVVEAGSTLEIKKASTEAVPSPDRSEDEDIDGCDVQVEVPTSDEDLPAAEGGVA